MKPTIWIFSLEPIESRYTKQWQEHIPKLLEQHVGNKFKIVQIDGVQKDSRLTPGAFLNFSDTNYWKSSQLCNFLEHHNRGETTSDDQFLFTDAWNPAIIQIKYMKDLIGFNWKLHSMFHAGSYDPQDFLGRLIGNAPWVRHAEKCFFHAIDHNYFATDFHISMFVSNLLEVKEDNNNNAIEHLCSTGKIVRSGWPMEYTEHTLAPYTGLQKKNLILFPHRIAPEKQVEIFRDLAIQLPQYEFVVCQDQSLSKHDYHTLLGESKLVFSANLQETLGISWYEGAVVGAIPMVPDRLSYSEMALPQFKYPNRWTINFTEYMQHRNLICDKIVEYIENYDSFLPSVRMQTDKLSAEFFSAAALIKTINQYK